MFKIGFIGLGHMGYPMVKNLLRHHHQVKVFDIMPDAVQRLAQEGAVGVHSPGEAVSDADFAITMLQTGEQVSQSCSGNEGIFAHLPKHAFYMDCSSIDIGASRRLHQQAEQQGIAMVDAPVSGGVKGAEAASLTFMVGGTEADFARAQPLLAQMGKFIDYAGPAGSGQAAKICNNMILAISMIAVSEGFKLGEKLGLDPQKFFNIASHSSAQCWSMTTYCPYPNIIDNVPANNDYKAGFMAKMMLKDLHLSQDAAAQVNAHTILGAKATELYEQFVEQGNAELDFSAIIRMLNDDA